MKLLPIILLLTFIYSCKEIKYQDRPVLDNNLIIGEWRLDSSSNRFFSYDRLIVLEDSSFYLFSGSDGGSMITKGRHFGKDSVVSESHDDFHFALIDSNYLLLGSLSVNNENYYRRVKYEDSHINLIKYLQQDTFRKKVIGWWKLIPTGMPVKLINYGGFYKRLTLNIRDDGKAVFYLENKFDSIVTYSYKVNPNGIDFNRGCIVGSDCKISFDSRGNMKLMLDRKLGDTLLLEKLTNLK